MGDERIVLQVRHKSESSDLCEGAEYLEATEQASKTGMLVKSPSGYQIFNPYMVLANRTLKRVKFFLTEFGMTPSSRSCIMASPGENEVDNKWKDLL